MCKDMDVVASDAEAIDRDTVPQHALSEPFAVDIAILCQAKKELPVMTPLGQVIRVTFQQIVRCAWHRDRLAATLALLKPQTPP
jgi:hypothetical protein